MDTLELIFSSRHQDLKARFVLVVANGPRQVWKPLTRVEQQIIGYCGNVSKASNWKILQRSFEGQEPDGTFKLTSIAHSALRHMMERVIKTPHKCHVFFLKKIILLGL